MSQAPTLIQYSEDKAKDFFELLRQLRPQLNFPTFIDLLKKAQESGGYQLEGFLAPNGELIALLGYRLSYDFVHGKHVYIDDLVTAEKHRSQNYGAQLLERAEEIARAQGCTNLRLCTGIDNDRGKRFYEKNLWALRAVVYKKKI